MLVFYTTRGPSFSVYNENIQTFISSDVDIKLIALLCWKTLMLVTTEL